MKAIGDILKTFNPVEDKYISREFQSYGIHLAEELGDYSHRTLYIRLAKTVPRAILEKSLSFVKDANAKSKPKLFMWKMKELKTKMPEPDAERITHASLQVTGLVQGVGFRAWTVRKARQYGITGWVRNVHDGSVEMSVEGRKAALESFIASCKNGPAKARVDHVAVQLEHAVSGYRTFTVRY